MPSIGHHCGLNYTGIHVVYLDNPDKPVDRKVSDLSSLPSFKRMTKEAVSGYIHIVIHSQSTKSKHRQQYLNVWEQQ